MNNWRSLSDTALVEQLALDNQRALREIFDRYWERLYAVAYNRLRMEEAAEDVVQEVLTALWVRRHEVQIEHLDRYLATAVKYAVFYEIRKRRRREELETNMEYLQQGRQFLSPEDTLLYKGFMEQIETEMNRLPEKCKLVFQYSREHGLSNKEIAEKLQISPKTVEAHISRAIRQLRTAFKGPGSFLNF